MMKNLLIWGAGDQGTVTLDCAIATKAYGKIDFLEIAEKGHRDIPNHVIYREAAVQLNELFHAYDEVIVATGNNNIREQKVLQLNSMNVPMATLIHPTAVISSSAHISAGSTVLANAVINTNAFIGVGCIINTAAIIEHDCIIEDFVNVSPKAAMAGHTKVGRKTFLGIGSTIIDGIQIGQNAIVGAGSVIIRDVPPAVTVAGVPATIIHR